MMKRLFLLMLISLPIFSACTAGGVRSSHPCGHYSALVVLDNGISECVDAEDVAEQLQDITGSEDH